MNRNIIVAITVLGISVLAHRCTPAREVPFTSPNEAQLKDLRGDFNEQFERGRILYAENCGSCHNMKVDGRMIIPDFSAPQLLDYEMRMQYPTHGERLTEAHVSVEELDDIQIYLLFRKPSGHPVAPLPVPQGPPKVN